MKMQGLKAFITMIFGVSAVMLTAAVKPLPRLPGKCEAAYYGNSSGCLMRLGGDCRDYATSFLRLINLKGYASFIDENRPDYKSELKKLGETLAACRARPVCVETGDCYRCEYYYSPEISVYSTINGKKVNIHVAYSRGVIRVGCPLIYSSF